MNAISLANKLTLTTRAMFSFVLILGIIAEQENSSVENQRSKVWHAVLQTADLLLPSVLADALLILNDLNCYSQTKAPPV